MFKKHMAMGLIVLFVLATLSGQAIAQESASIGHWVSTWTTALYAPNPMPGIAAEPAIADKTIRMINYLKADQKLSSRDVGDQHAGLPLFSAAPYHACIRSDPNYWFTPSFLLRL